MDACAQHTQQSPYQAGAAGGGQQLIPCQPYPQSQKYQPVGGQRRVGKHPDGQCREQNQHSGPSHRCPAAGCLAGPYAAQPGKDGLGKTALQGIAQKPPDTKILKMLRQQRAEQFCQ